MPLVTVRLLSRPTYGGSCTLAGRVRALTQHSSRSMPVINSPCPVAWQRALTVAPGSQEKAMRAALIVLLARTCGLCLLMSLVLVSEEGKPGLPVMSGPHYR